MSLSCFTVAVHVLIVTLMSSVVGKSRGSGQARRRPCRLRRFLEAAAGVGAFVFALAVAPVRGETAAAGASGTEDGRLEADGRTIALSVPGLTGFRGGFSAMVEIEGVRQVLSSDSGILTGTNSPSSEVTPYGTAVATFSTIRFVKEQIDLMFRLDKVTAAPVAYVSARVASMGAAKAGLTLTSDMSGVRVDPGQTRWGQRVALFMEPPAQALARWTDWVARTHGARTSKGSLSGWNSWNSLRKEVTGKDVLNVAGQVVKSGGRLRPDVIQIDAGYESNPGVPLVTNAKFPEGLPYYARGIAASEARPGLNKEFKKTTRYNKNIAIENNLFRVFSPVPLLSAYSVDGLIFRDNRLEKTQDYPVPEGKTRKFFDIVDSDNIHVEEPVPVASKAFSSLP